jgi:integrase
VNGKEYTGPTYLAATERNRTGATRIEADARRLVLQGKEETLKLEIRPFDDAARQFLKWAEGEYREHPASAQRLRTSFASLREFFGSTAVTRITPGRIEDYKSWRRRTHEIREVTLRHDLHALSTFFHYAEKHNWSRENPVRRVEIPSDAEAVRMHVLTAAEEKIYFEAARRYPNLSDLGRLMLQQGCRPEEFLELPKHAVVVSREVFRITRGKTKAARRTLKMTRESRTILIRRMESTGPYVFPGRRPGSHLTKLNGSHNKVLKMTGLSFVIYDFRHTFATRMAEAGMPLATLAAILGHSNLRSIMKYIHPSEADQHAAMVRYSSDPHFQREGGC